MDHLVVNGRTVTPEALVSVEPSVLASVVGTSLPDFLNAVARWAEGAGLPYGIEVDSEAGTISASA
jgi:hypothetical protein